MNEYRSYDARWEAHKAYIRECVARSHAQAEENLEFRLENKVASILERLEQKPSISVYLGDQGFYWLETKNRKIYMQLLEEKLVNHNCTVTWANGKPMHPTNHTRGKLLVTRAKPNKDCTCKPRQSDLLIYQIPGLGEFELLA